MSDIEHMLADTADRLFSETCTHAVLEAAEAGVLPAGLWSAVEETGIAAMMATEDDGGIAASASQVVSLMRIAGRYGVPGPLPETVVARWIGSRTGLRVPPGPLGLSLGLGSGGWRLDRDADGWSATGQDAAVPWGLAAGAVVVVGHGPGECVAAGLLDPSTIDCVSGRNLAGELRDDLRAEGRRMRAGGMLPPDLGLENVAAMAALARAGFMIGELDTLLAMSVGYAGERVQFGRPIGRFQAVQQQLAELAGAVAAAAAITESAAAAVERGDGGFLVVAARARLADAVDTATAISHQVHGAIGFTREYPLQFHTRRLLAWRDEGRTAVDWRRRLGQKVVGVEADRLWSTITAW